MNEHYLHLLWRTKRLPLHLLETITGEPVRILHVGFYNTASGPDFFNGKIEIGGLIHIGNIEMHLKSSDWYAHNHHLDDAYNNVILHVVYEHDKLVFIEGVPIPTIELKEYIDEVHLQKTLGLTNAVAAIPCANQLPDCPAPVLWDQIEKALFRRIERKSKELSALGESLGNDPRKVLFHAIAGAFGMKTNQLPFQELAHRLPFERVIRAEQSQLEAIVFGTGGFLEDGAADTYQSQLRFDWFYQRARLSLHPANHHSWHFKGCRPSGFPTMRLAQFASFIQRMDWSEAFWELPAKEIKTVMETALVAEPSDYWKQHYHFGKEKQKRVSGAMSLTAAHVVIINSVVPFLWWLSEITANTVFRERAIELLEYLPAEKNVLLDHWKEKSVKPKSAAESQGLLELKNEFCNRKQCLNCKVGLYLLKK